MSSSSTPSIAAPSGAPWRRLGAALWRNGPLASRIVAALFGGYALASLTSVAAVALPIVPAQAVLTGMLLSFVVYVCAVIWVFAVRSARRAWAGLLLAAIPLLAASAWVWRTPVAA